MNTGSAIIGRRGFLRVMLGAAVVASGCGAPSPASPVALSRDRLTLIYFFTNP